MKQHRSIAVVAFAPFALVAVAACGADEPHPMPPLETVTTQPSATPTVASTTPTTVDTTPPPAPKPPLAELQKKAIADWAATFNAHDAAKLMALYAPNAVLAEAGPEGLKEKSVADAQKDFEMLFKSSSDAKCTFVRVFQKGNVLIEEFVGTGTNDGEMMGKKATGKKFGFQGIGVTTFGDDGKITRDETYIDQATMLKQLGVIPATPGMPTRAIPTAPTGDPEWITAKGDADEDKLVDAAKATWPLNWNKKDRKGYEAALVDDSTHVELSGADFKGKKACLAEYDVYAKALPDHQTTISDAWAFGPNIVIMKFSLTGTFKNALGPVKPTGKPITIHGIDVDVIDGGKMKLATTYTSGLEFAAQAGLLPKGK